MVSHFYNTCLKSFNTTSLFKGGIIISLTFLEGFTIYQRCFPIDSLVTSAVLQTTFLETAFKASIPVFVTVSDNCFPYLFNRFLASNKNQYPLTNFLVFISIE